MWPGVLRGHPRTCQGAPLLHAHLKLLSVHVSFSNSCKSEVITPMPSHWRGTCHTSPRVQHLGCTWETSPRGQQQAPRLREVAPTALSGFTFAKWAWSSHRFPVRPEQTGSGERPQRQTVGPWGLEALSRWSRGECDCLQAQASAGRASSLER